MLNLFLITLIALSSLSISSALASGGPSGYEYEMSLDQAEYRPGDTVTISIRATFDDKPLDSVSIRIVDAMHDLEGRNIVYKETKRPTDKITTFTYKIPEFQLLFAPYRYMVIGDSPYGQEKKMFFTKENASKLVISDLKIFNPMLKQGDRLQFEAKVTDGVGNPVPHVRVLVAGDIPHQICDENSGYAGAHLDASPMFSSNTEYSKSGKIAGAVPILNTAMPGKHSLKIFANGDAPGYVPDERQFEIEIQQFDGPQDDPYTVLAPLTFRFEPGFMSEQTIDFTGRTAYNGCGQPIGGVPIRAEIKRYDPVSSQWIETLAVYETVSDYNGYYDVYFEPIGLQAGYFSVLVTSDYPSQFNTFGLEMPHNIRNFTIGAEGREFVVEVDAWYSIPISVQFFQDEKKIIVDVDTSDPLKRFEVKVPHELLDGQFVFFVNGVERTDINYAKFDGYSSFHFESSENMTRVELVGTSAIPEFGHISVVVLAAASALTLASWRRIEAFCRTF
jgi:hypothetical protein